jgi:hypothetical protein
VSNSHIVTDDQARKQAKAELQLLLAQKKVEGCRDLEAVAYETYRTAKTDRNLRAWKFVELALRRAERDEELCRLQVEAVLS